ncbi:MAG: hypothetical protein AAGA21_14095 [Pseudomonadota bacterium]
MSDVKIDRFDEIKRSAGSGTGVSSDQVLWLIDEIDRLRNIEDVARKWSERGLVRSKLTQENYERPLLDILQKFPRPVDPGS